MKHFPKSVLITGITGLALLLAGDLYNSFGFLVCAAGGLTLLAAWVLELRHFSKNENEKTRRIIRIVKAFTFIVILAVLLSFFVIEGLILTHRGGTEEPNADTVIVLGAGLHGSAPSLTLKSRLEAALDYLNAHPEAVAVLTGGQGAGETVTEASAMAKWLTDRGIDPKRLYLEEQATNTLENLRFSKALIERENLSGKVAVLSNSFHLFRAELLAKQAGLGQVQTLSAPVPAVPLRWLTVSVYLREYCSILLMLVRGIV